MAETADPAEALLQIAAGACLPRCLHTVAELAVADVLGDQPRSIQAVADAVGANPDALYRILRLLAANGIFELQGTEVIHTAASRLLSSAHPQSMRAIALMFGLPVNWSPFLELRYTAETGQPASAKVLPEGYWNYFAQNSKAAEVFNSAMVAKAHGQVAAVMAAYDFAPFPVIGDIGGGRGHLISAVLAANQTTHGVLFDLPHVIRDAGTLKSERLSLEAGSFFSDPLPSCDLYCLMEVIHDWGDAQALEILAAVRRSAPKGATLLLIEAIVPDDSLPHFAKTLDIVMLTLLGGKQRTQAEYWDLARGAGFSPQREIPTFAGVSLLEAKAS
jgi:hypothetical protein